MTSTKPADGANSLVTPSEALQDGLRSWNRLELDTQAAAFAGRLRAQGSQVLATLLDNSPAWVAADLAAEIAGVVHVPLPLFFMHEQLAHAILSAGADTVLAPVGLSSRWSSAACQPCDLMGSRLVLASLPSKLAPMPPGTAKITFTSGTTGAPKGVCLGVQAMRRVAEGLVQAMEPLDIRRHLCALPFAVLLENIAGLRAPLLRGATCITPPLEQLGWTGSSGFDASRFHAAVERHRPDSLILLPQMLRAWSGYLLHEGLRAPASLKFVAVGGAAVGTKLLAAARGVGIPAYEGYGLSEGASVQTLNLPGADRPGTAGRALPHASVRVAADGELEVAGSLFCGYLGETSPPPPWWPTGDLGSIDAEGFVQVLGRKKQVVITAYGRNVSPEWVETALRNEGAILQAVVFGEAQPALSAVLWPIDEHAPDTLLQAGVNAANATLPDYARVGRWVRARAAFGVDSGMATANGRPQRAAIARLHAQALGLGPLEITEAN